MNNIELINNTDFIYGLKKLNHGTGGYAECYMYDDDNILKFYYDDEIINEDRVTIDMIKPLVGIENNTYVFPKKILVKDDKLIGYIMKYINADNMHVKRGNISIDKLVSGLDDLKDSTKEISDMNMITDDVRPANILFDTNKSKYYVIDPDQYIIDKTLNKEECYNTNMSNIIVALEKYIMMGDNELCMNSIVKFIYYSDKLSRLYGDLSLYKYDLELFKEFLFTLIDETERKTGNGFKTVGQMQSVIMRRM